ncbi:histidine kinase [Fulvivirgaceae bacterium BMA10]|uniref:Histidine kinase n=1 Tax=Splendidivirga corallicola TaxID=3051826 RepID=A0ABT8KXK8_9BACT|nr:histidine kinase [Fulvivirgaceae bacterium BMA10]
MKRNRSLIRRYGYWVFAVGAGIVLIYLEDEDIEPFFSIAAFLYWSLLLYWAARWLFGQIKSTIKQKKEKTRIELLHLQSQVNPHFFFNTLNNLYGLVEKDTKKAQQLILKLSDMMRYGIYEGQKDQVTIEEEVEYLNNYIALHNARYRKKNEIRFNQHIQKEGIKVMPLLFIILVENAFKHGVENLREGAYVHINLIAGEDEISFAVENNFDNGELPEEPGIGLKNLKRRLELAYPKSHSLTYTDTNDVYKAQLTLKSL